MATSVIVDSVHNGETRVGGEIGLVVGHQDHPQGNGVGRDQFVQRTPRAISMGGADRPIRPCSIRFEGSDRNIFQETVQG